MAVLQTELQLTEVCMECVECAHGVCTARTHSSGHWQEAVIANQHNVEDGCRAEQVVHDQPHLAETFAQHPPARQAVRDVHRDAESACKTNTHTHTHDDSTLGPRQTRLTRLSVTPTDAGYLSQPVNRGNQNLAKGPALFQEDHCGRGT